MQILYLYFIKILSTGAKLVKLATQVQSTVLTIHHPTEHSETQIILETHSTTAQLMVSCDRNC